MLKPKIIITQLAEPRNQIQYTPKQNRAQNPDRAR